MEEDAIKLTLVHEWMTVSDAKLLLEHYYLKMRPQRKYGGWKTVQTLMNIAFGNFQRDSEENLRARIDLIKSHEI
tara:strand:+ start:57 stop:281 length:225 start_codon:yes stop_codon:yes gene_type:complete